MSIDRMTDCLKMDDATIYKESEVIRSISISCDPYNESYYDRIAIIARRGTFLVPDYEHINRFTKLIRKEFLQMIIPKYTSLRADTLKMFVEAYRVTCPRYLRDFESLNRYIESRLLYKTRISDFNEKSIC